MTTKDWAFVPLSRAKADATNKIADAVQDARAAGMCAEEFKHHVWMAWREASRDDIAADEKVLR